MDSILDSVKKLLGITEDYNQFDSDIIMHINSVFMILNQLGVGPEECFSIEDNSSTWSEFIPKGQSIESVKTYVFMKVKMMFDPPTSSIAAEAFNKNISELEWRLNAAANK